MPKPLKHAGKDPVMKGYEHLSEEYGINCALDYVFSLEFLKHGGDQAHIFLVALLQYFLNSSVRLDFHQ